MTSLGLGLGLGLVYINKILILILLVITITLCPWNGIVQDILRTSKKESGKCDI